MKIFKLSWLVLFCCSLLAVSSVLPSCSPDDECEDDPQDCDTCTRVYKPNVYIYPEEKLELDVTLEFPMGGHVVESIPEYGSGWSVTVDTNGLIDNSYSFLFYESSQPDLWQKSQGWFVERDELEPFFRKNMTEYGFAGQEIEDFIEYWIPRLTDYDFYSICPQTKDRIESLIELQFSKDPDNLLRLFYVIKGHRQLQDRLSEPVIESFARKGFYAAEWGVVIE